MKKKISNPDIKDYTIERVLQGTIKNIEENKLTINLEDESTESFTEYHILEEETPKLDALCEIYYTIKKDSNEKYIFIDMLEFEPAGEERVSQVFKKYNLDK